MDIVIKILQFICSFTLLVLVHEMGHLLFGKLFGVRVEEFRIFFGKPWIKWRWGETTYGIGYLPFGGFAKLSGMVDESMDSQQLQSEPQPWEFRSKPAWQRLIIILGGIMMNILLAFGIYVGTSLAWGDTYISNSEMPHGYVYSTYAKQLGFCDGDKIVSIGGNTIEDYSKIMTSLLIEDDKTTVVERDGHKLSIEIPVQSVMELSEQTDFLTPRLPFVIESTVEGMGAAEAGLLKGDKVVGLNDQKVMFYDQITPLLSQHAGDTVELTLLNGERLRTEQVAISPEGQIGVALASADYIPIRTRSYNLWQAIPRGAERVVEEMGDYWKQLKMIVKPETEMYKALGGPISIGGIFPNEWNWQYFWRITALLSVILAIMNVLPIPALDGGHALFILIEMVTGRRPSDKVMMVAQMIGMALLFLLMFYATFNDIVRLF